jgi:hypothetical protein
MPQVMATAPSPPAPPFAAPGFPNVSKAEEVHTVLAL